MIAREDFGPTLRRERERRGINLQAIADETKVSAALFAAMERNDFSRWPDGLFRRSFLRAYARAIGRDPERTVKEYQLLFHAPRDGAAAAAPPPRARAGRGHALAALVIARFAALRATAVRLCSWRPAPPVDRASALSAEARSAQAEVRTPDDPPRHLTKRRAAEPAQTPRRRRPRRGDRPRPRA